MASPPPPPSPSSERRHHRRPRRIRRIRRRPIASTAATAAVTAAIALITYCDPSSVIIGVHAGLRGPQQQQQQFDDLEAYTNRRLPQHGAQRPRRPLHLPPHMLPPPGHDGSSHGNRSLLSDEEDEEEPLLASNSQHHRPPHNIGKHYPTKGNSNIDKDQRLLKNRPNQEKRQQQRKQNKKNDNRPNNNNRNPTQPGNTNNDAAASSSSKSRKKKIKQENDRRHSENAKLKGKKKQQQQQQNPDKKDRLKQKMKQQKNPLDKKDKLKQKVQQLKQQIKDDKLTKVEKKDLLDGPDDDNNNNGNNGGNDNKKLTKGEKKDLLDRKNDDNNDGGKVVKLDQQEQKLQMIMNNSGNQGGGGEGEKLTKDEKKELLKQQQEGGKKKDKDKFDKQEQKFLMLNDQEQKLLMKPNRPGNKPGKKDQQQQKPGKKKDQQPKKDNVGDDNDGKKKPDKQEKPDREEKPAKVVEYVNENPLNGGANDVNININVIPPPVDDEKPPNQPRPEPEKPETKPEPKPEPMIEQQTESSSTNNKPLPPKPAPSISKDEYMNKKDKLLQDAGVSPEEAVTMTKKEKKDVLQQHNAAINGNQPRPEPVKPESKPEPIIEQQTASSTNAVSDNNKPPPHKPTPNSDEDEYMNKKDKLLQDAGVSPQEAATMTKKEKKDVLQQHNNAANNNINDGSKPQPNVQQQSSNSNNAAAAADSTKPKPKPNNSISNQDNDTMSMSTLDKLLQNIGISPEEAATMTMQEKKDSLLLLTNGKFDVEYTAPPMEDEDPPQGHTGGGGGVSSLNKPPPPTPSPATPSPTPEPTRRPKNNNNNNNNSPGTVNIDTVGFPDPIVSFVAGTTLNKDGFNFVPSLTDHSTQLDDFEEHHPRLEWSTPAIDPWGPSSTFSYHGDGNDDSDNDGLGSMKSGVWSSTYYETGEPIYSNLTLTTDPGFDGGVLTFKILANSLVLPTEAFYVTVDGVVELAPDVTAKKNAKNGGSGATEWVEHSVPVGRGKHKVTWVHVYNPFGLESLPPPPLNTGGTALNDNVGLWMDDLRYAPFTTVTDLTQLEMTNGVNLGGNDDDDGASSSLWEVVDNGDRVVAYTSDIATSGSKKNGNADIQFIVYSLHGGTMNYRLQTSTTAPHDDFAILFNGEPVEAIFGEMIGYETRSVEVPKGKVLVTLRHRKNPGRLGNSLLQSLLGSGGATATEGMTLLEGLTFDAHFFVD